ncbi:GMC family oxidoreductase [Sulfitobacter sp. BSw21498]|uniref:GMC family oxidoreductase n=1 Tax=Sulfitobacter sp. BSw21498 TaxID=664426 RepID=UPI0011104DD9|nr:GMC oxidoreductase [Sulfitobacter sp. BSw21498]
MNEGASGGRSPSLDRPNLQFRFIPAYLRDHGRNTSWGYGVTLHVCDLLPKSRGQVTLSGPGALTPARIEPNYLSHPDDIEVLLAGLKIARRVMAAPAIAGHLKSEVFPGKSVQSDADLIADIRARAETIYHPVGTCRMGMDTASVVDPEGRVRGVHGLRAVDASVMPSIIAGNTNAPTMMIAENVADMMIGA